MGHQAETAGIGRRLLGQCIHQPFLRQQHLRAVFQARHLLVLLAIDQGHRRVQPHQRHAAIGQSLELVAIANRRLGKRPKETLHVQRLAVGAVRCQEYPVPEAVRQVDERSQQRRLEVTGEGILHQHDAALTLGRRQLTQGRHAGHANAAAGHGRLEVETADQRAVDHADLVRQQLAYPLRAHYRVVQPRRMRQVRDGELQRADQVITQWALIATVVQLKET
ncbi:hypothetical protein D3C81_1166640 [compost metagenome]